MLNRFETRVFHSVLISDLMGGFLSHAHYLDLHLLGSKGMYHFLAQGVR